MATIYILLFIAKRRSKELHFGITISADDDDDKDL